MDVLPHEHPLLRCLAAIDDRLDDLAPLDPEFLPTQEKERALVAVDRELARLEGLRVQLPASSRDVADQRGARSAASRGATRERRAADARPPAT